MLGESQQDQDQKLLIQKIEWKRVENVIKNFKKKYKKTCLSFDTRKSDIMIKGIKNGVDLINDVSGFNYDKNLFTKIKKYKIQKFFIICKEHQIQCSLIQNIKMFY